MFTSNETFSFIIGSKPPRPLVTASYFQIHLASLALLLENRQAHGPTPQLPDPKVAMCVDIIKLVRL